MLAQGGQQCLNLPAYGHLPTRVSFPAPPFVDVNEMVGGFLSASKHADFALSI